MPGQGAAGRRYAEAAFGLAEREDVVEPWLGQLELAAGALGNDAVVHMLENPAIPLPDRHAVVDRAIGGRIDVPIMKLIILLLRRGKVELLPDVAREYRRLYNRRQGIVTAIATSAAPLDPDERDAIGRRLVEMTGARVELSFEVDPSILGGVVVRLGDQLIDGSVRGRLERLRSRLAAGAL